MIVITGISIITVVISISTSIRGVVGLIIRGRGLGFEAQKLIRSGF